MKVILSLLFVGFTKVFFGQNSETTITIKVRGITCSSDYKMIQENVEKLEGVDNVKVRKKAPTSTFEIRFDSTLVSRDKVIFAIENTGSCENPKDRPYKVKKKRL